MKGKKIHIFHKFTQKDNISLKLPFSAIKGKVIEWTNSINFLGMSLDEHLSVIKTKVSKNIGILHKAKNIFSKRTEGGEGGEDCLGKHHSNKTEKNRQQTRQAIRIIYPAEYT